jgi:hypothetical protein
VPKKRGPKTDVLEALLKRVDGLEKRLHSEGKSDVLPDAESSTSQDTNGDSNSVSAPVPLQSRPLLEIAPNPASSTNQLMSPIEPRCLFTLFKVRNLENG